MVRAHIALAALVATMLAACGGGEAKVQELIAGGKKLIAEGRYEAAVAELSKATAEDRNSMEAWLQLGHAYAGLNKHDNALSAYVAAKKIDRHAVAPHVAHAKVQIETGNLSQAILELTLVTEMDSKNLEALLLLGRISQMPHKQPDGSTGVSRLDLERAEMNLEAAVALAPQNADAKAELARLREKLGKKPAGS